MLPLPRRSPRLAVQELPIGSVAPTPPADPARVSPEEHQLSSSFSDLGLPADVVTSLAARGITEAFPIQSMAIPPALAGRDVCGRAPTGSGKTLAFGIPLSQRGSRARVARPRALVLAPTRELAAQIHEELRPLLAPRKRSVASFYGGVCFTPPLKEVL